MLIYTDQLMENVSGVIGDSGRGIEARNNRTGNENEHKGKLKITIFYL